VGINSKVQIFKWQAGAAVEKDKPKEKEKEGKTMDMSEEGPSGKDEKISGKSSKDEKESKGKTSSIASAASAGPKLVPECAHHGNIIVLSMKTCGDLVVVGDLMKSISVLLYKASAGTIEEVARDYDSNWMTAVEALSDDVYLGAENGFHLFTVCRNLDSIAEEDRTRLDVCGRFHLGEFVNVLRSGSLVMNLPDLDNPFKVVPSHVFGTINGVIGVVAPLSKLQFQFFSRLEEALEGVIKGVGGFSHKEWRDWRTERKSEARSGFIDGDLVEQFLDLTPDNMELVAKKMEISVTELSKRVEDVSRIH